MFVKYLALLPLLASFTLAAPIADPSLNVGKREPAMNAQCLPGQTTKGGACTAPGPVNGKREAEPAMNAQCLPGQTTKGGACTQPGPVNG